MPKQQRQHGKPPKPSIKIAKAEMTLNGFEHDQAVLKQKRRLHSQNRVQEEASTARKSSLRPSTAPQQQRQEPSDDLDSQECLDIDPEGELPMNEDIVSATPPVADSEVKEDNTN